MLKRYIFDLHFVPQPATFSRLIKNTSSLADSRVDYSSGVFLLIRTKRTWPGRVERWQITVFPAGHVPTQCLLDLGIGEMVLLPIAFKMLVGFST